MLRAGPRRTSTPYSFDLVAHRAADALGEVGVPGRGEERLDREGRAVVRARRVSLALRLDPEAGGAVGDDDRGDSEPADGDRRPRGAGDALRGLADDRPLPVGGQAGTPHAGADDEADLLLARHRGDDVLRGALAELRQVGRGPRGGAAARIASSRQGSSGSRADHDALSFVRRPPERGGPSGRTLPREAIPRHGPFGERICAPVAVVPNGGVAMSRRFILAFLFLLSAPGRPSRRPASPLPCWPGATRATAPTATPS